MSLKYFISGFFVKTMEGFDDSMIRIPICANITKTKLKIFEKVLESLDVNEIKIQKRNYNYWFNGLIGFDFDRGFVVSCKVKFEFPINLTGGSVKA